MAGHWRGGVVDDKAVVGAAVQRLCWHMLRQGSEMKLWETVKAVIQSCGVAPPDHSLQTRKLLKLCALVWKLEQGEAPTLDLLTSITGLLQCLLGFEELAGDRQTLGALHMEAKCQVVLHCYHSGEAEEANRQYRKYFGPTEERTPESPMLRDLWAVVQGRGRRRQAFLDRHTYQLFRHQVLTYIREATEKMAVREEPEQLMEAGREEIEKAQEQATVAPQPGTPSCKKMWRWGEEEGEGEEIPWTDDDDDSVAHTPPSTLPVGPVVNVRTRDSFIPPRKRSKPAHKPQERWKPRMKWEEDEIAAVLDGVHEFGVGQWARIKEEYPALQFRSNVNIKDKWRTLAGDRSKKY